MSMQDTDILERYESSLLREQQRVNGPMLLDVNHTGYEYLGRGE